MRNEQLKSNMALGDIKFYQVVKLDKDKQEDDVSIIEDNVHFSEKIFFT